MAFPALAHPRDVPAHLLFPEHYEASKRMIVRDFLLLGSVIVGSVVFAALIDLSTRV
jgi:hypothetical protein